MPTHRNTYIYHICIYTYIHLIYIYMYIYIHLCMYINPHVGQLDETVETHQIDDYINGIHWSIICTISGV